jgi:hypothetical protein
MFSIGGEVEAFDLSKIDPIIAGLLHRLPRQGATWPEAERKLWLGLMEQSFKLIYRETDLAGPVVQ